MSCRRVRRELVDRFRFGEIGPESAPHLDHLAGCHACRDEVGTDRALVIQLRRALAARVEDASPPQRAWYGIVRQAQMPERRAPLRWSTLVARWRMGTTMAATGLALALAVSVQAVPLGQSFGPPADSTAGSGRAASEAAGAIAGIGSAQDPAPTERRPAIEPERAPPVILATAPLGPAPSPESVPVLQAQYRADPGGEPTEVTEVTEHPAEETEPEVSEPEGGGPVVVAPSVRD